MQAAMNAFKVDIKVIFLISCCDYFFQKVCKAVMKPSYSNLSNRRGPSNHTGLPSRFINAGERKQICGM